jgi:ubiquinone/menaquinone biosynthesis C-methylase UbiE
MQDKLTTEQAVKQLMLSEEGKKLIYECYYDWDVVSACQRFQNSEEWQAVSSILYSLVIPGLKALDLGAGNGIASFALSKMDFEVIAVEPDSSELIGYSALVKMMQHTFLPINVVSALGETLPFSNSQFSLVYLRQVLHHATDLNRMLSEIARILRPGGVMIATREHVIDDETSRQQFLKNHSLNRLTGQEGAFFLDEYLQGIEKSGMRIKKVFGPWDSVINHYPCSESQFRQVMSSSMKKRFGRLGDLIIEAPGFEKLFRHLMNSKDRLPGRMYSFVAIAN